MFKRVSYETHYGSGASHVTIYNDGQVHFVDHRNWGCAMPKDEAITLARAILSHYEESNE